MEVWHRKLALKWHFPLKISGWPPGKAVEGLQSDISGGGEKSHIFEDFE